MKINDKIVTESDLLRLAFKGTAIEPHLDRMTNPDRRLAAFRRQHPELDGAAQVIQEQRRIE